jgi:hypothetical protein
VGIFKSGACTACSHPKRSKIDAQLAAGASIVEVASAFGLSKSALHRHCQRHLADGLSDESAVAVKQLIASTQRALYRAERKGDERAVMDCLRLLTTLRTQSRIAAASAQLRPGRDLEEPERRPERDPQTLVEKMRQIYGLNRKFQATVYEHAWTSDERLIEQLGGLVARRTDSDPVTAAIATQLASRILNRPLDGKTELEVKRLEGGDYESNGMVEAIDKLGADAEEDDAERAEGKSGAPSGDRED